MKQGIRIDEFIKDKFCPEKSIHLGKQKRFDKAKEQFLKSPIDRSKIIEWTNEFLTAYGMTIFDGNNEINITDVSLDDLNKNMKLVFKGITNIKDIIWMKFTKKSDHLGVVACSNDINFDIPPNKACYDEPCRVVNEKIKRWKYNTSGIIVHSVDQEWNKNYVLVFPLIGLCDGDEGKKQRHEIETGIGNYLIFKGVPILDYYSHRL